MANGYFVVDDLVQMNLNLANIEDDSIFKTAQIFVRASLSSANHKYFLIFFTVQ